MQLIKEKSTSFINPRVLVNARSPSEQKFTTETSKLNYHYISKQKREMIMINTPEKKSPEKRSPEKRSPPILEARNKSQTYFKLQDQEKIVTQSQSINRSDLELKKKSFDLKLPDLKTYRSQPIKPHFQLQSQILKRVEYKNPSLPAQPNNINVENQNIPPPVQSNSINNLKLPQSMSQVNQTQLRNKYLMYDEIVRPNKRGQKINEPQQKPFNISANSTKVVKEILLSYGSHSKAGYEDGKQKINQDRDLLVIKSTNSGAFGVMDGHGSDGEKVSQFITDKMRDILSHQFNSFNFIKVFSDLHNSLRQNSQIESQFSGTTATLVLINNNVLKCGWVGDSRAILGRRKSVKKIDFLELSKDHKPDQFAEKARIERMGGFVDNYHSFNGAQYGPYRVWVKGAQYPGLAMSRSLGDQVAASVGVSQVPDINEIELKDDDLFMIVASDGIWEFVTNQQAVDIVYPYYLKNDPDGACLQLYNQAYGVWKQVIITFYEQFDDRIDDITSIVVFFNRE